MQDKSSESVRERQLALLALALERVERPPGAPPELAEIAAWAEGALPAQRAAEVERFVARDPECYRLRRDYLETRAQLAQETAMPQPVRQRPAARLARRLQTWWQTPRHRTGAPLSALAAATAMLLLAVGVSWHLLEDPLVRSLDQEYGLWAEAKRPPPQRWGWRLGLVTRGERAAVDPRTDPERSAFLAGLARRVPDLGPWPPQVTAQLRELPSVPAPCAAEAQDCPQRQQVLAKLGEWTLLLQSACVYRDRGGPEAVVLGVPFWERQGALLEDLRGRFDGSADAQSYYARVDAVLAVQEQRTPASADDYCELSNELMELAFLPESVK